MKRPHFSLNSRGDTLVEVLICIAIISLILTGGYVTTARSSIGVRDSQEHGEALKLLQTQAELTRTLRETAPDTVFNGATLFCLDTDTMERHSFSTLTTLPPLNTDDFSQYPDGCRDIQNLYNVAVTYDEDSGVFSYVARWDRAGGGRDQAQIFYRLRENIAGAFTAPAPDPDPGPGGGGPPPAPTPDCTASPSLTIADSNASNVYYLPGEPWREQYRMDLPSSFSDISLSCTYAVTLTARDTDHGPPPDPIEALQLHEQIFAEFYSDSDTMLCRTKLTDDLPFDGNTITTDVGTCSFSQAPTYVIFKSYYLWSGDGSNPNSISPYKLQLTSTN